MKLLFVHRLMNNILYLKLFQQHARIFFFFISMTSNYIPAGFGGGHYHHLGQSTSTSQGTAIVKCLIPHTLSNPLHVLHEHWPPMYVDGGREVDWALLISVQGKGNIINTNVI